MLLAASIVLALLLSRFQFFHDFLLSFGEYGHFGIVIAGMLFVSTFTVAPAVVILLILSEQHSIWEMTLLAGLGSVLGDLLIFRFVKYSIMDELSYLYFRFGGRHINRILHTRYTMWTLPLIGALIIASPLPDEIGVSLMGIAKMNTYKFIALSFVLNCLGIFFLLEVSSIF